MTSKEFESLKNIEMLMQKLLLFKDVTEKQIQSLSDKVEAKHVPINLEDKILSITQQSVNEAIKKVLTDYNSPLIKLVTEVINKHSIELKRIINESLDKAIKTEDFKQAIFDGFSNRLARSIISSGDSAVTKISNELKQDQVFRSKLTLAVSNLIEEHLKLS